MATVEEFISKYPRLFHMAEGGSWGRIQTQGLLSTRALLAQFEVKEPERNRIESEWRRDRIPLEEGATIRDQRPMPQKALQNVLKDMTPTQWYRLLNGKTFFWTTQDRLQKMLNAKPYRNDSQEVITVDTRKLVDRHQEQITLSRINSGSTNGQARRGSRTFKTIEEYPPIRRKTDVAELTVAYHVPHIMDFAVSVESWRGENCLGTIWRPEAAGA